MSPAETAQDAGCFYCGGPSGGGGARGAGNLAFPGVWRRAMAAEIPCPACAGRMAEDVLLLEVDEARSTDPRNPFRTGNFAVVAEAGVRRCLGPADLVARILAARWAFVAQEAWKELGLAGCEAP